jgi:hypothetical protein
MPPFICTVHQRHHAMAVVHINPVLELFCEKESRPLKIVSPGAEAVTHQVPLGKQVPRVLPEHCTILTLSSSSSLSLWPLHAFLKGSNTRSLPVTGPGCMVDGLTPSSAFSIAYSGQRRHHGNGCCCITR